MSFMISYLSTPAKRVRCTMRWFLLSLAVWFLLGGLSAQAIDIVVDYRYDTNLFFDSGTTAGQQARASLEAAASRYSSIITTSLAPVTLLDDSRDARIGLTHPSNGVSWDVSPAATQATDALAGSAIAEEYRGPWSISQDQWILYAGAMSIPSAAQAGTGTGLNFTSVFTDGASVLNRGFRTSGSVQNLPVWGGYVTFDNDGDQLWHLDPSTAAPLGSTDLYSIALHEIGHALGLGTEWTEWTTHESAPAVFSGAEALAAYNADNGGAVTGLNTVSASNGHFADGSYESIIFNAASPNMTGTVGAGNPQGLLMEPTANFTNALRRFELTNVDVAALRDVGWSTVAVPEPSAFVLVGLFFAVMTRSSWKKWAVTE